MAKVTSPAPLREQQQTVFERLWDFANASIKEERYFVLRGDAGTGKTYLLGAFAASMRDYVGERGVTYMYMTATTNKAAKVLRRKVPCECSTIYKLLGLTLSTDSEQPSLVPLDMEEDEAFRNCIVFVDEASMITNEVMLHIDKFSRQFDAKVVFIGDPCQLPPVEKEEQGMGSNRPDPVSPVWLLPEQLPEQTVVAQLTDIIRYDGAIEELAASVRGYIADNNEDFSIANNTEGKQGVFNKGCIVFRDWMRNAAERNLFLKEDSFAVLAFTNKQVQSYNEFIRSVMFQEQMLNGNVQPYYDGERVVLTAPYQVAHENGHVRKTIARNRDEFVVAGSRTQRIRVAHALGTTEVDVIELQTEDDGVPGPTLPVVHPNSRGEWQGLLEQMAGIAKASPKGWQAKRAWKEYWETRGLFAQVEYAYAQTTHCSQGSTYHTVFVDVSNIMGVRKATAKTKLQALYVALTRATDVVIVG